MRSLLPSLAATRHRAIAALKPWRKRVLLALTLLSLPAPDMTAGEPVTRAPATFFADAWPAALAEGYLPENVFTPKNVWISVVVVVVVCAAVAGGLRFRKMVVDDLLEAMRGREHQLPAVRLEQPIGVRPDGPVTIRAALEFLPVPEFEKFAKYVHERNHEFANELEGLKMSAELRRQESTEQLADLRELVDTKVSEAITASNSSASKIHGRIDKLQESLGEMRGMQQQSIKSIDHLTQTLMDKALKGVRS
jgi:hypothetical protein